MEESILLLSSMSPKVSQTKKHSHTCHATTKLALKKNLRRSSIYDKKAEINDVIVVDTSAESSNSSRKDSSSSPIIISDSECSSYNEGATSFKADLDKTAEIEKWIQNVNLKSDDQEEPFYEEEESSVAFENIGQPHSVAFERKDKSVGKNESGSDVALEENKKSNISEIEQKRKKSQVITKRIDSNDSAESSSSATKDQAAGILDELYGHSWRPNEHNILTYSEPRKKKQPLLTATGAKSERKQLIYRNPYLDDERIKTDNLMQSLHRARVKAALMSPLMVNLKKICDTDSDSDTAIKRDVGVTRKKLNFCEIPDEDNEVVFDEEDLESRIKKRLNKKYNATKTVVDPSRKLESSDEKRINRIYSDWESVDDKEFPNNTNYRESRLTDLDNRIGKESQKEKNVADGNCGKSRKEQKYRSRQLCDSTSSSDNGDDDNNDGQWWKPPRKSMLKLYRETKTTKVFSFLASLSKNIPPNQSDPSALIYREDFNTHRDSLVQKLFKLYNSTIFGNAIPQDTPINWNKRMRGTAGYCYCRKTVKHGETLKRSVRIVLSTKVVDCPERVRDTLVHELCHAATWMVNHVHNGHGAYWKAWADRAMAVYPELPPIRRCHDYDIHTKYTYKCVKCGYSIGRHTKSLNIEKKRCGYCYGKFEVFLNKQTKEGKVKSVVSTPRKVNAFALFVKEHYSTVKTPNLKHGEVMQLLGQQFSELKLLK